MYKSLKSLKIFYTISTYSTNRNDRNGYVKLPFTARQLLPNNKLSTVQCRP